MATNIPSKLRSTDIMRFATRAAQLEKVKPIMAYWCYYWFANQILARRLHKADDECHSYTTTLLQKLEEMKEDNAHEDAIVDEVASQAYVEQFALSVFERADNAVQAGKASRQTADTFQAAATFLELLQNWGPLDAETASKIKYAKYHALRIAKAVKAGENPNLAQSHPDSEMDQEVGPQPGHFDPSAYRMAADQPRDAYQQDRATNVSNVHSDTGDHSTHRYFLRSSRRASTSGDYTSASPAIKAVPSVGSADEDDFYKRVPSFNGPVSPVEGSSAPYKQEGYSHEVSPINTQTGEAGLDSTDLTNPHFSGLSNQSHHSTFVPSMLPRFQTSEADSPYGQQSPGAFYHQQHPELGSSGHPIDLSSRHHLSGRPSPDIHAGGVPHTLPSAQPSAPQAIEIRREQYKTDDEAVAMATKHAKWAISALNFEDVTTAVKELKSALESLGVPQ